MTTEPDLADLLRDVARALRRRGSALAEPHGLSMHQLRALRTVDLQDGPRIGDLAKRMRMVNRSATDVVDDLEAKGYLRRERDPSDRRATVVQLTESGRAVLAEVDRLRRADAREYFAVLPASDRRELSRILRDLDAAHGD